MSIVWQKGSMRMMTVLRKINRTLLEMWTGILLVGILCQAVGIFLVEKQLVYAMSLWFGILLAVAGSIHMYRTLDRGLDLDEKSSSKMIFGGYMTRYVILLVILGIIMVTGILNPLVVFMAYMSLKVTALIQPFTHKFYNRIFHETE